MKSNKATVNRPGENRIIDAPFVITDINDRVEQLKTEAAWDHNDRNGITLFKTDGISVVLTCFHKGAILKHSETEGGIISIQLLTGCAIFKSAESGTIELLACSLVNLHPGVHYEIVMEEETTLLLTTSRQ